MNKKNYLVILLSLFIILPHFTYAECAKEEMDHFKEIEDQYKVTYEFNKETKDYTLKMYVAEPQNYLFATYKDGNIKCNKVNEYERLCNNIPPGEYELYIIGISETCKEELKTIKIKLDQYNPYSEDSLCNGIEEFVLCQPTYGKEIDYDSFVSRVNTYKKTKQEEQQANNNENNKDNKVLNYIKANLFNIIIITIFTISIIATIIMSAKALKKSRRLE